MSRNLRGDFILFLHSRVKKNTIWNPKQTNRTQNIILMQNEKAPVHLALCQNFHPISFHYQPYCNGLELTLHVVSEIKSDIALPQIFIHIQFYHRALGFKFLWQLGESGVKANT